MFEAFEDKSEVCAGCPCKGSPYVPASGQADTRYFCVGGSPGQEEVSERRAFVGPAGKMVREIMDSLSLSPLYTNVLKRRPIGKKPSRTECFRCGLHLIEEMKRHNVVVILALGQTAFNFLNGQSNLSVNDVHGLPIPMNRFGMDLVVVGTHDPGNILRRGGLSGKVGNEWVSDLEDFRDVVKRNG